MYEKMEIKFITEHPQVVCSYYIIDNEDNDIKLSDAFTFENTTCNGNGLGTCYRTYDIYNALSDDEPYIDYRDTDLQSFVDSTPDGEYNMIRNGLNHINFMQYLEIKKGRVIVYIEDNDLSNTDFYFITEDEMCEMGMENEDRRILNNALEKVRGCIDDEIVQSYQ